VGAVRPDTAQNEPAGHGVQSDAFPAPGCADDVPRGHAMGVADPAGQYRPAGHSVGTSMAVSGQYVPLGHGRQEGCPVSGWNVPGRHSTGADDPGGVHVPLGALNCSACSAPPVQ
jgi:hypothetical protein